MQPDFTENLFPGFIGIYQYQYQQMVGNFHGIFSVTEIHREFISQILLDTTTITNNSVFYTGFVLATIFQ